MTKTVLLIGGAGFIGTHLKSRLNLEGHSVDIIDKLSGRNINDDHGLITDINYSHVVFLAAEANLRAVKQNPTEAIKTMTSGLMKCLLAYPSAHFTYISSSMVYGNWDDSVYEYSHRAPVDLYGQLKLAGEGIVRELHRYWTIIRPTAVYGPGDNPSRVMPLFIEKARNNETLTVKGHNNQLDFTHVDDVVSGIILGMDSTDNRTYNISYGKAVHLENIAKYICEKVGSGSVKVEIPDVEYPQRGTMSIERAQHELGYQPSIDVFAGIDQLIQG
jgi:nucleoside-diphosphate-sugar epimerase